LDLQLPVQSVPITTKGVSLSVTPVSSPNKTDRYDTTEILVAAYDTQCCNVEKI
jgi:hypothetical protein